MRSYFVINPDGSGIPRGPFTQRQLADLIAAGDITPSHLAAEENGNSWSRVGTIIGEGPDQFRLPPRPVTTPPQGQLSHHRHPNVSTENVNLRHEQKNAFASSFGTMMGGGMGCMACIAVVLIGIMLMIASCVSEMNSAFK